jgi:hypothetical protein
MPKVGCHIRRRSISDDSVPPFPQPSSTATSFSGSSGLCPLQKLLGSNRRMGLLSQNLWGVPWKVTLPYDDTSTCMSLTFHPVVSLHRPLWYGVRLGVLEIFPGIQHIPGCCMSDCQRSIFLLCVNALAQVHTLCHPHMVSPRPVHIFYHHRHRPGLSYWYIHGSTTKLPVLFLSGIGVCKMARHYADLSDIQISLRPYLPFISDIFAEVSNLLSEAHPLHKAPERERLPDLVGSVGFWTFWRLDRRTATSNLGFGT